MVYITELGRHLLPDPNSSWEVPSNSNLEPQLERVPGGASTPWVRLEFWGLPFTIPGCKLILSVGPQKCSSGTIVTMLVSPCESQDFLYPSGGNWPGPQGSRNSKTHSLSYRKRRPLDLLAAVVRCASRQAVQQAHKSVRGLLLPLKPEQDYFTSFPNISAT